MILQILKAAGHFPSVSWFRCRTANLIFCHQFWLDGRNAHFSNTGQQDPCEFLPSPNNDSVITFNGAASSFWSIQHTADHILPPSSYVQHIRVPEDGCNGLKSELSGKKRTADELIDTMKVWKSRYQRVKKTEHGGKMDFEASMAANHGSNTSSRTAQPNKNSLEKLPKCVTYWRPRYSTIRYKRLCMITYKGFRKKLNMQIISQQKCTSPCSVLLSIVEWTLNEMLYRPW